MTGDELKTHMENNGLTVRAVAVLTESSTSAVYMWLRGERTIGRAKEALLNRKIYGSGKVMLGCVGDTWNVR